MTESATYKDQKAIMLKSGSASFTFLPDFGAILASAVLDGKEFMVQRPEPKYRVPPFDGSYEAAECSGMDTYS
jgi:hypothetical protein